jgi:uncharacterized protein YbjT (DUF2867 family)
VLFGASGFVGANLLNELLANSDYEKVTAIVRRPLKITHPKLQILIADYRSLAGMSENINADDVFITLGTTKKNTPILSEYYEIDHDYPVLAAKIAKERGAKSAFLLTAVGANAKSNFFYVKTKGETERDIIALDFDHTNIFRPSMILGNRQENRPFEKAFINIWSTINPALMGNLNRYKGIDGKDIAKAMNCAAKNQSEKLKIYHWHEMHALL